MPAEFEIAASKSIISCWYQFASGTRCLTSSPSPTEYQHCLLMIESLYAWSDFVWRLLFRSPGTVFCLQEMAKALNEQVSNIVLSYLSWQCLYCFRFQLCSYSSHDPAVKYLDQKWPTSKGHTCWSRVQYFLYSSFWS